MVNRIGRHNIRIIDFSFNENLPIKLGPKEIVFAIGDIHGRQEHLRRLLTAIQKEIKHNPKDTKHYLVYLGDYVDRGPDSRRVLSTVLTDKLDDKFEIHRLLGNHDWMMLHVLRGSKGNKLFPAAATMWMNNGGVQTIASYDIEIPEKIKYADVESMAQEIKEIMIKDKTYQPMQNLENSYQIGNLVFVHAGIDPRKSMFQIHANVMESSDEEDIIWIREPFLHHTKPFESNAIVVHGHTRSRWAGLGMVNNNRISLDSSDLEPSVLTCAEIHNGKYRLIQAIGEL